MAFDKAKTHISKYGLEDRISVFDVSSATVSLAALALGCDEAHIAKTMSFINNENAILIVAAGDVKISNSKFKAKFRHKATMIDREYVESIIGHASGGVCPFGINDGVDVYLDESLKRFEYVYPACGSDNSAVKLNIGELEKCSECKEWIDVCVSKE